MLRIVTLLLALAQVGTAGAEVYRWTDEQGRQHYSDRKPLNEDAGSLPGRSYYESRVVGIWNGSDELGNEHSWIIRDDATISLQVIQPGTSWRMSVDGRWKLSEQTIRILVDAAQLTSRLGDTTGGLGWDVMLAEIQGATEQSLTLIWNESRVDLQRQR